MSAEYYLVFNVLCKNHLQKINKQKYLFANHKKLKISLFFFLFPLILASIHCIFILHLMKGYFSQLYISITIPLIHSFICVTQNYQTTDECTRETTSNLFHFNIIKLSLEKAVFQIIFPCCLLTFHHLLRR